MLCYRCGSHVPDASDACANCGQKLAGGGLRQATATFSRRRLGAADGAPYRAGDVVRDRYAVSDLVGAGPLGFVFRAADKKVDVEVALKTIQPRLVQTTDERLSFARVIKDARKLQHPNLARVYEDGEDQDWPYYTAQFLDGLTLRKIIDLRSAKGQFFTLEEAEPILAQILAALDVAHEVGTHGDLKPDNVIVLPDLLKVTDFGLGIAIPRLPFIQALKQAHQDAYLAPEYVQGDEVDPRADLYSVGVILGEMLGGQLPDGATVPELRPKNASVTPAAEGLYRRLLNANPTARPKSAQAVADELAEIVQRTGRSGATAPAAPAARPASAASPIAVALAPAVLTEPEVPKPPPPVFQAIDSDEPDLISSSGFDEVPVSLPPTNGVHADDQSTELMPSLPPPAPTDLTDPGIENTAARRTRNKDLLRLTLLAILGLGLGSAAAYWWLERYDQPVTEQEAAAPERPDAGVAASPPSPAPIQRPDEAKRVIDERLAAEQKARDEKHKAPERKAPEDPKVAERKAEQARQAAEVKAAQQQAAEDKRAEQKVVAAAPTQAGTHCPEGMKLVPPGAFKQGTPKDDPMMGFDERGLRTVELAGVCVDVYEYPNRRGANPQVNVAWADAKKACEGHGKRLCTEEEWEKACKGPSGSRFPYGSQFDAAACNTEDDMGDDRHLAPSGKFARCRSGYGISDMSGNVAEWTSSPYAAGSDMSQKGGSFDRPDYAARCSARKNGAPSSRSPEVGFRCCADPT